MKVTRGDPAGAIHFKPFAQWELHDGAASDDSVKTEALHSPSGTLDLERGVDDLIAAATAGRGSTASGAAGSSQPAAAAGLKLDLKLLDGGSTVELSGDVVVTTDGMAVTPSGMGFTPMGNPATALASGDDDWFATYSGSGGGSAGAAGSAGSASAGGAAGEAKPAQAQRPEDMAGLSPLLTPSNNKLCAALVDAF